MKRYYKKWHDNILKAFGQLTLVLSLLLSANTWAITTSGLVVIDLVKLLDDSWVHLTVGNPANLENACSGEVQFQYVEGSLSEIYYAMLMTAKSTGAQVRLGYTEYASSPTWCELVRVELYQ